MKSGSILTAVVLGVLAVGFTWWLTTGETTSASPETTITRLTPSPTGPHPKVVVDQPTHEFGRMILGGTDQHTFLIKNEGKAVLQLGEPEMTCQCTVAKSAPSSIPPGESAEITLEWKPTAPTDVFSKGATIKTNDPDMPVLTLAVEGIVNEGVIAEPKGVWQIGSVPAGKEIAVTGYVFSPIHDDFHVTGWESDNKLLSVKTTPMTEAELTERNSLSGTKLVVSFAPEMPIGRFKTTFTVTTNAKQEVNEDIELTVEGTRLGPIQILPAPGTKWTPQAMAVDLGRFPASKGAEAEFFLFISGMPGDETLKLTNVESTIEGITAELIPAKTNSESARQRYTLRFRAVPGIAPQTRLSENAAQVTLTTNHPEAKQFKFFVELVAAPK